MTGVLFAVNNTLLLPALVFSKLTVDGDYEILPNFAPASIIFCGSDWLILLKGFQN